MTNVTPSFCELRYLGVIRRTAHILLFVAAGILILHNLTPHDHTGSLENEKPGNLLEWLTYAFQIDPGVGHLECFSKAEPVDAQLAVCDQDIKIKAIVFSLQLDLVEAEQILFSSVPQRKFDPPDKWPTQLRGPPIIC